MSTALSIYERMADPIAAIDALGTVIAKSGVIACQSIEQGKVFAWECLVRRTPPLMLAERYHVIFGKLSMKAEAMLDGLIRAGGKPKVISRTADKAEIEITIDGQTQSFSLTKEEAMEEPFAYIGKEEAVVDQLAAHAADNKKPKPKLKAKYATPRARMQMMWARVVSDGVRVMCPSVNSGVYTPEEIEDYEEAGQSGNGAATKPRAKKADIQPDPPVEPAAATAGDPNVIDGEFVAKQEPAKESPAEPLPAGTTEPQYATSGQLLKIEELLEKLNATPEGREKILAKRKVNSFRSLTIGQADELIAGAAKMLVDAKAKADAATAAAAKASADLPPAGPCSFEQQAEAKRRLTELKQVNPPAFGQFVGWLKSKGMKIEQLSVRDCDRLIAAANDVRQMDDFFKVSLETWQADNADVPFETASSKN